MCRKPVDDRLLSKPNPNPSPVLLVILLMKMLLFCCKNPLLMMLLLCCISPLLLLLCCISALGVVVTVDARSTREWFSSSSCTHIVLRATGVGKIRLGWVELGLG